MEKGFLPICRRDMEEMGISGWRLEILETDPKGARICID